MKVHPGSTPPRGARPLAPKPRSVPFALPLLVAILLPAIVGAWPQAHGNPIDIGYPASRASLEDTLLLTFWGWVGGMLAETVCVAQLGSLSGFRFLRLAVVWLPLTGLTLLAMLWVSGMLISDTASAEGNEPFGPVVRAPGSAMLLLFWLAVLTPVEALILRAYRSYAFLWPDQGKSLAWKGALKISFWGNVPSTLLQVFLLR